MKRQTVYEVHSCSLLDMTGRICSRSQDMLACCPAAGITELIGAASRFETDLIAR
jgi:hypothetical protein